MSVCSVVRLNDPSGFGEFMSFRKYCRVLASVFTFVLWTALFTPAQAATENPPCSIPFKKVALCGELMWTIAPKKSEMPTEKDKAEFTLRLFQEGNKSAFQAGDTLSAKLFMPSMGHGSLPTHVEEESGSKGVRNFRVKDVYFSMPGKWEIRLDLKRGEKLLDRAVVPYSL